MATIWDRLPSWISKNLRSKRSWKALLRCWIASWIAFVILLPNKSLQTLGNAAYFALFASIMIPPSLPLQTFIMAVMTLILGLLFGWGFGAAAMRAANAARSQTVLKEALEKVAQSAAGLANPDALYVVSVFEGAFLDVRASVVFGVFLAFTTFLLALIRAYVPNLILFSIYGTIAIDVFCSYGPLFPIEQYFLLNSILISCSCYVALAVILIVLVLPESMSTATMYATGELLGSIQSLLEMQKDILHATPEDIAPGGALSAKIEGAKLAMVGEWQRLTTKNPFIHVEFSYGKWNSDDIVAIQDPCLRIVARMAGLLGFPSLLDKSTSLCRAGSTPPSLPASSTSSTIDGHAGATTDNTVLRQVFESSRVAEEAHSVRPSDIIPILDDVTQELRDAATAGLKASEETIAWVNSGRRGDAEQAKRLDGALDTLRSALENFREKKRTQLLEPYRDIFANAKPADIHKPGGMPLRALYLSYVFCVNLMALSEAIVNLLEGIQSNNAKRTKNRIWAPKGLRALGKALTSRGGQEATGEDAMPDSQTASKVDEKSYKLDPDSKPPKSAMQRVMNLIHSIYLWTGTPEALFTFRYVVVSVALWLPAVFKTSAHFNYVEKGLWALIMAQTTLNIYASDQLFNYVTRVLCTIIGALYGLLGWYIGNGNSHGNPYGSAAMMAVMLVPPIFIRNFAPPQYMQGALLGGITFVLVIGYSWLDGHLTTLSNPGIGWGVAWKRLALVLVGCVASFIAMLFPHPTSSRKAVRLRNASTITGFANLYGTLIARWVSTTPFTDKGQRDAWADAHRQRLVQLGGEVIQLKGQTEMARWEGSIRGAWPSEAYENLSQVESRMIMNLAQLGAVLTQMDDSWRIQAIHSYSVLNPNFITDVMTTFTLIAQSLRTGEPLSQVLHQSLLTQLLYHGGVTAAKKGKDDSPAPFFDLERVQSLQFMYHATALVATVQIVNCVDDLQAIVKGLCGEVPLAGFEEWRAEFERAQRQV